MQSRFLNIEIGKIPARSSKEYNEWLNNIRITLVCLQQSEIDIFAKSINESEAIPEAIKRDVNHIVDEYSQSAVSSGPLNADMIFRVLKDLDPVSLAAFQRTNKRARLLGGADSLWKKFLVADVDIRQGRSARDHFIKFPGDRRPEYLRADGAGTALANRIEGLQQAITQDQTNLGLERQAFLAAVSSRPKFQNHPACKLSILRFLSEEQGLSKIRALPISQDLLTPPMDQITLFLERHSYFNKLYELLSTIQRVERFNDPNKAEVISWLWSLTINFGTPVGRISFYEIIGVSPYYSLFQSPTFRNNLTEAIRICGYDHAQEFILALRRFASDNEEVLNKLWQIAKAEKSFVSSASLINEIDNVSNRFIQYFLNKCIEVLLRNPQNFGYESAAAMIRILKTLTIENVNPIIDLLFRLNKQHIFSQNARIREIVATISGPEFTEKLSDSDWIANLVEIINKDPSQAQAYLAQSLQTYQP